MNSNDDLQTTTKEKTDHRIQPVKHEHGKLLLLSRLLSLSLIALGFVFFFHIPHALAVPIRIGEINPLTGKLAKHGTEIHEGILFAVEEVNARGGIKGNPVELISRDDQSLPEVAINQTEELLYRAKVSGLVGGYVDSLVGPVSEFAAKNHTPYVASASLQRNLTLGRQNPYFFRVAHLDGIVEPLCGFVTSVIQAKRAAILFAATPGSTEFGEEVRRCLEKAGVEVPIFEKFRPGSPDFSAFLLKVSRSNIDILISGGFFPDHLILVRQIRENRIPLKAYLGPWGVAYPSFMEEIGEASEGILGMCAWNPAITMPGTEQESGEFVEKFSKRFGKQPNTTTMHGYASARALLRAMESTLDKGSELSGEAISEQLRSLDLLLPMERLAFDQNGDPKHYKQVIVQIQKGRIVPIYPPERAKGKME
jgi:branched-chain amino acid transport system substrate-binding protein